MHSKSLSSLKIALLSFSLSIFAPHAAFAEADPCSAKVLHPVKAIDNPSSRLEVGSTLESVSQFNVDKKTGVRQFCQHGGYCYPETITINGKKEKALKLTNCRIDKKESEDANTELWSLSVIRSSIGTKQLKQYDVENKLADMGLCNACAHSAAQYYSHKPDSKCGKLVKSALEGNPKSVKELSDSPSSCTGDY